MATNSMVPYSNPAGNNQTSPGAVTGAVPGSPIGMTLPPTSAGGVLNPMAASSSNPLIPSSGSVPTTAGVVGTNANATNSDKQLTDIFGQGIGGDLNNLLNSVGGVNSATLQAYDASLQPGFAQAGANLNSSLGAGGVSANSSVAALGQANLQAQEQGMEAGENAQLLQSGQNLEASILTGTENLAAKEVATSGWDVFGQVLGDVGQAAGPILKALAI